VKVQASSVGQKYGYGMARSSGASPSQALGGGYFSKPASGPTPGQAGQVGAGIASAATDWFADIKNYKAAKNTAKEIRAAALFNYGQQKFAVDQASSDIKTQVAGENVRTDIGTGQSYERQYNQRGTLAAATIRDAELRRAEQMKKEAKKAVKAGVFKLVGTVVGGVVGGPMGAQVGGAIGGMAGGA